MTDESCASCRFCISQTCRRHGPLRQAESWEAPRWPLIIDPSQFWCGDFEWKATPTAPVITAEVSEIAGRDTDDSNIRADSLDSRDSIAP